MTNPYPDEKFSAAIHSMATSPATIQKRLDTAYQYNLIHVNPEEVPESVRFQFKSILEELPNALSLSTDRAIEIASIIMTIADAVRSGLIEGR